MLSLLTTKQKIAAIKRYREMTGVGLREAKMAVEQMERERVMGPIVGWAVVVVLWVGTIEFAGRWRC